MADEINRIFNGKLKYTISIPSEDFFTNRPRITQMQSLYLQEYKIVPDTSFTEKIKNELEDIKL